MARKVQATRVLVDVLTQRNHANRGSLLSLPFDFLNPAANFHFPRLKPPLQKSLNSQTLAILV